MTATLERLVRYPVKSLDPEEVDEARLADRGALAGDREFAVVDAPADAAHDPAAASVSGDGDYVNGKRTRAVHRLRSSVDRERGTLSLRVHGEDETHTFDLGDRTALNEWLSDYFGTPVSVRREAAGGYPDDRDSSGPTVVSAATLRETASWFSGVDAGEMRRRLRPNLVVGGVPAFWEDRLYADRGDVVRFTVGGVRFEGVSPCARCVVPSRDPDTGAETEGFRETFIEKRRETRPPWLASDRFDHDYRLMVNTRVPESEWGKTLSVGDPVEILGTVPE
ncbi:MAG: MOSC domain-containing protein [Haloferacaceae archaeon]